jgi:hypothetical protein
MKENGEWLVSTRRCIDCKDSVYNPLGLEKPLSHYDMMIDVLSQAYPDVLREKVLEHFTNTLDRKKSYYFVLIHHQNKLLINYESVFGKDYARLCLTSIRDENMNEEDIYKYNFNVNNIIFVPEQIESIDTSTIEYDSELKNEGVIIRVRNKDNKISTIKLQYPNYQFAKVIGPEQNIIKGLVYLYQNNKLLQYLNNTKNIDNFRKMTNPQNENEVYDILGVIDAVFRISTGELYKLYCMLYDLENGSQYNAELYILLPEEYKCMMYGIRGVFFRNKAKIDNNNNVNLTIEDVYHYLKHLPTDVLLSFLRMRRLMFNYVIKNPNNLSLVEFSKINQYCNRVHLKLCAIFTARLYPNIKMDDFPPQKKSGTDNFVSDETMEG